MSSKKQMKKDYESNREQLQAQLECNEKLRQGILKLRQHNLQLESSVSRKDVVISGYREKFAILKPRVQEIEHIVNSEE